MSESRKYMYIYMLANSQAMEQKNMRPRKICVQYGKAIALSMHTHSDSTVRNSDSMICQFVRKQNGCEVNNM